MLTYKVSLDRVLAGAVLLAMIFCLCIVLYATYAFATLEFKWSVIGRKLAEGSMTPCVTAAYRQIYPYSWMALGVAVVWAVWIVRKTTCSLLAIVIYVGVFSYLALFWLLFTLMALYLENQSFYVGTS